LDKYNINIKKEKIKVIEENLNNKLKKINNDIKQLELNSELFKLNFMPKLNEYYRYIQNKKDIENQKNLLYINKIYLLKKHILFIKSRITKRQKEKEFLMREIFLQISIKERKLNLPEYYKDILLNDHSYEQIKEKYGNEINKEEYNRISKYIESLDVNDMEIIFENLNKLTHNNMELLHEYNKIQEKNLNYKKHRKKIEIEINSDAQKEINNLIKEKESTLNIKIKKYKENKKIYFDLTNDISYKNSLGKKRSNLFIKLDSFLKMLKDTLNYKINTEDDIKGKITEEKIMMNYLEKIEIIINRFLSVHKGIKNNYSDKIKSLKSIFDKEKKFRKAQEQKKNIALKFETDRKKLFDRYNKILFLPKKKVYYKKPNKTITFEEKFEKFEEKGNKIEDFLFD
jgi:sulfur relay (sulfurtransferase) DsrF/TusC family protein